MLQFYDSQGRSVPNIILKKVADMLETLLGGKKGKSTGMVATNKVRLVTRATRGQYNIIGIHEFEVYDDQGRNLCRTAGYIPSITCSPAAGDGKTLSTTIDGDVTNWTSTYYASCNPDGSAYVEYTFPQFIKFSKWRMNAEGQYQPTLPDGIILMIYDGSSWREVVAKSAVPADWGYSTWREFTQLSLKL
jgi:hypothetical protein